MRRFWVEHLQLINDVRVLSLGDVQPFTDSAGDHVPCMWQESDLGGGRGSPLCEDTLSDLDWWSARSGLDHRTSRFGAVGY